MKNLITEARRYMTDRERKLRTSLVKLLRDDGKGHHHAKYAERLSKFDINIISLKDDPNFTAAISFEEGIIYIGEGFLTDPSTFFQLNILMRHELAHNLLMHEIRMMRHLGEDTWKNVFGQSASLHRILNIIMDDEISNKKYSDEDKQTVRNMYLNGKLIGGLVTEDHRQAWLDLPLEKMYEKVKEELDSLHASLSAGFSINLTGYDGKPDFIKQELLNTMSYSNTEEASSIPGSLDDFVKNGCYIKTGRGKQRISKSYRDIIEAIYNSFEEVKPNETKLETLIKELATSHPTKEFKLINPETAELVIVLYSPEQKQIAMDILKKYRSEYLDWYNKMMSVLNRSNYSSWDTREIYTRINGGVSNG